jgi:hypothetical protein
MSCSRQDSAAGDFGIACLESAVHSRTQVFGSALDVVAGPGRGRQLRLTSQRQVVGRSDAADLALPSPKVSGRHAAVWSDGGTIWVVDLGSTNGSALNGQPVGARPCPVRPGDRLQLGDVVLVTSGGGSGGGGIDIGSQHAGAIANAERDVHLNHHNDSRSYNNYDLDVNPLPRARGGRYLIYAGLAMKTIGILMCLYWSYQYLQMFVDMAQDFPATEFYFPPIYPWIPAGTVFFVVGSTLSIVGLVAVYSTRRKARSHEYR